MACQEARILGTGSLVHGLVVRERMMESRNLPCLHRHVTKALMMVGVLSETIGEANQKAETQLLKRVQLLG